MNKIEAKVICDSQCNENRITSMILRMPKFILGEFARHRMFSFNSASSRAIPVRKQLEIIEETPWIPRWVGKNKKGMAASEQLTELEYDQFVFECQSAKESCLDIAENMMGANIHKQHVSRYIEPWMMVSVIVTSTEWSNFFTLRCHPQAQPEMQELAYKMLGAYLSSTPNQIDFDEWHIPYLLKDDSLSIDQAVVVCTARAARMSYENFDGQIDYESDKRLHNQLLESGHWSPFEHCAHATKDNNFHANFRGFSSYRRMLEDQFPTEKLTKEDMVDLFSNKPEWIYE